MYGDNKCQCCEGGWRTSTKVPMTHRWYNTSEKKPEEKRDIVGMDSGGNERHLKFYKNMFWLPDLSMYVYYTPSKWRYA